MRGRLGAMERSGDGIMNLQIFTALVFAHSILRLEIK
jgi:hypothetical protein